MTLIDMKTATITEKGQIAIPKNIRKHKGFSEGERIVILAFNDRLELRPLTQVSRHFSALMSEKSLAKGWLSKGDEKAWKRFQKAT